MKTVSLYHVFCFLILGLVACSDQKPYDKNLNGVWQGSVVDSQTHSKMNFIYEFQNQEVKVVKSMAQGSLKNTMEVSMGDYKKMDSNYKQSLKISYRSHSCSTVTENIRFEETFSYEYVQGVDQIRVQYGVNQFLDLKRLTDIEVDALDTILSSAEMGCYIKDDTSGLFQFKAI